MALAVSCPHAPVLGIWPVRTMLCAGAQSAQHRVCGRAWTTWPSESGAQGSKGCRDAPSMHLSPERPLLLAYSAAVVHQGACHDTLDVDALRHSGLVRDLVAFLRAVGRRSAGETLTCQNRDALNLRDYGAVELEGAPLDGSGEAGKGTLEPATDPDHDCILRTLLGGAYDTTSDLFTTVSLPLKWLPDPPPPLPSCIHVAVTFESRSDTFTGTGQSDGLPALSRALCAPQLGPALAALHASMLCDLVSELALQHGPLFNGAYLKVSRSRQHAPS